MHTLFFRLAHNDAGAFTIEYALLASLFVVLAVTSLLSVGTIFTDALSGIRR